MRKLHSNGWSDVDALIVGLANVGYSLTPQSRILDFGCGEGRIVYAFRDAGYDAVGFDIHDYLALRAPEDKQYFRCGGATGADNSDMTFDPANFHIPYDDDSFDLVLSTSTLEHVLDLASVLREIARVTKPNGIGLHLFPRHRVLFEPHIFVPLAGMIQKRWWFQLWAALGWTLDWHKGHPIHVAVDSYMTYCATGLCYRSLKEIRAACAGSFLAARLVDHLYYSNRPISEDLRAIWRAMRSEHPVVELAKRPKLRAVLLGNPVKSA